LPPAWLEVIAPHDIDRTLQLGAGELEAISLALELRADAVLIDERKALGIARRLGLLVMGTIGLLELAARRRLIDLPRVVAELRKTNFRCPDFVYDELLKRDAARQ
jgi:predicted nucleic acid-binding protein